VNAKSIVTLVLLAFVAVSVGYLIVSESKIGDAPGAAVATQPVAARPGIEAERAVLDRPPDEAAEPKHRVIAYYFHNTQRCMTCNKIERLAEEALREQFAAAFESGQLEWRVVNMEVPPNTLFVHEYGLVASSLVLVNSYDGEQRDWTLMEKVWQYVHDDEAEFKRYVAEQARNYLESES